MDRAGSFWRGRALPWNPRQRAAELERQKWVSSAVSGLNQIITDLAVDQRRHTPFCDSCRAVRSAFDEDRPADTRR